MVERGFDAASRNLEAEVDFVGAPANALEALCRPGIVREIAARNAASGAARDPVTQALDAALFFARDGFHDAARPALRAALVQLRKERGSVRKRHRFRVFCAAAYLAYARKAMIHAELLARAAVAQARRLAPAERRAARHLARSNLARVLEKTGRRSESLALYEASMREASTTVNALNLAFAYHAEERPDDVIAVLGAPKRPYDDLEAASAELLRAASYFRLGKRERARQALRRYDALAREHGFEAVAL
jgi:tetratricopeptide (TPR) repeat protein